MSATNTAMTTQEVADKFHQYAQKGDWAGAEKELYAEDVTAIEPEHTPEPRIVTGREAITKKNEQMMQAVETMHGGYSHPPVVAGKHFAVAMGMDVTMKGQGRMNMDEIAVYEVKDDKIAKAQFFY